MEKIIGADQSQQLFLQICAASLLSVASTATASAAADTSIGVGFQFGLDKHSRTLIPAAAARRSQISCTVAFAVLAAAAR